MAKGFFLDRSEAVMTILMGADSALSGLVSHVGTALEGFCKGLLSPPAKRWSGLLLSFCCAPNNPGGIVFGVAPNDINALVLNEHQGRVDKSDSRTSGMTGIEAG